MRRKVVKYLCVLELVMCPELLCLVEIWAEKKGLKPSLLRRGEKVQPHPKSGGGPCAERGPRAVGVAQPNILQPKVLGSEEGLGERLGLARAAERGPDCHLGTPGALPRARLCSRI